MKHRLFTIRRGYSSMGALVLLGSLCPASARAQHDHAQPATQAQPVTQAQLDREGELVRIVRDATRRFQDASVALAEGYVPRFGCVSGSHEGAMGVHLVNDALVGDVGLDPRRPELLVYEPMSHGRFRLVAVDYLVLSEPWHQANPAPPELIGQLFHLFDAPNRFGLPAFYTLHV